MEQFLNGKVTLHRGDCLEVLPTLADNSVDACVCDPPYHLTQGKKDGSGVASINLDSPYGRSRIGTGNGAGGFMGQKWDGGDIAFRPEVWMEVLRVLKPGGHLLAFSGTRTYHRMACAIEDAGFEIRDQIGWCYGSGFPKSHDISKAIDRAAGEERERPRHNGMTPFGGPGVQTCSWCGRSKGGSAGNCQCPKNGEAITDAAIQWQGWGTALKPAWEPICLARKPISESSIAANVLRHGTGAINIDGCRVETEESLNGGAYSGTQRQRDEYTSTDSVDGAVPLSRLNRGVGEYKQPQGRWPANLIHDGSEEVLEGFPEIEGGTGGTRTRKVCKTDFGIINDDGWEPKSVEQPSYPGSGSAARFFYTAKADADDRLGSKHPTVKPLDLIRYLIRLVTPDGGVVIDPFAGTGTAGEAAFQIGMRAILIEREPEYQTDIVRRMGLVLSGPDSRRLASIKQESLDDTPLFGRLER